MRRLRQLLFYLQMKHLNGRTKAFVLTVSLFSLIVMIYGIGILIPQDAVVTDFAHAKQPPSFKHLFGTDNLGRDILKRTLKGMSISVTVGIVASCISAVIGILIGIAAAAGSRFLDGVINWLIDLMMGLVCGNPSFSFSSMIS